MWGVIDYTTIIISQEYASYTAGKQLKLPTACVGSAP